MKISDFNDERIADVRSGRSELTADERAFLIRSTSEFEECFESEADLSKLNDIDLMGAAYSVWSDYASCL